MRDYINPQPCEHALSTVQTESIEIHRLFRMHHLYAHSGIAVLFCLLPFKCSLYCVTKLKSFVVDEATSVQMKVYQQFCECPCVLHAPKVSMYFHYQFTEVQVLTKLFFKMLL